MAVICFRVVVSDGCGNSNARDLSFEVIDCKAPGVACINGLVVVLMPVAPGEDVDGDGDIDLGAASLTAESFIASPSVDCSQPVTYSINFFQSTPDIDQSALVLTCDEVGTQIIEVYAWDGAFNPYSVQPDGSLGGPNYNHCEVFILVEDNESESCTGNSDGQVAGIIFTEEDDQVENVEVRLSGQSEESFITGTDGAYFFENLEEGYDYTIGPELNEDHGNGVSTFDVVMISKHILGVEPLSSPV